MAPNNYGSFSKSRITDVPIDPDSEVYLGYKKTIPSFPDQAVYIYSFKENRMLYAQGWYEILGYKDSEINMLTIVNITTEHFLDFSNELNDKALEFLLGKSEDLEAYSFTIELEKVHKDGRHIPLFSRVGVHKAEKGMISEIIGVSQVLKTLKKGRVMQYAAYGPEKSQFEETLSKELFKHFAISRKEKEALALAANGYAFKEIAHQLEVSQSAIEKRILPLYKRFNVKSLPHLISFAHENFLL
ncbi:LuxR C-terminal-related transcriptional regulator [Pseudozobellia thermophila]|uniref:Regulatory protein, luxR family n=1 Tax=Pseudozobellia thermophila TaxID=192903 RepID=A0A1M6C526_9FLAO|nr:LuxR C-terminal-related transcriptional regulator [Pseudozobellia thermophila]SHI56147.1 regulatory protein, luxR family [Pseudozobellia thermophila]